MDNFSEYIDTSYDNEFAKLLNTTQDGLKWSPWVGDKYRQSSNRILFILESAYKNESNKTTIDHPDFERQSIYEVFIKRNFYSCSFRNIRNFVQTLVPDIPSEVAWRSFAYHNVIQRAMDYTKTPREKPTGEDYRSGCDCLKHIIEILRPTTCICMGVTLHGHLDNHPSFKDNITRTKPEPGKIGRTYKRDIFDFRSTTGNTRMLFTTHPARCSSTIRPWAEYVRQNS